MRSPYEYVQIMEYFSLFAGQLMTNIKQLIYIG